MSKLTIPLKTAKELLSAPSLRSKLKKGTKDKLEELNFSAEEIAALKESGADLDAVARQLTERSPEFRAELVPVNPQNPRNLPAVQKGKGVIDQSPIFSAGKGEYIDEFGLIRQRVKDIKDAPRVLSRRDFNKLKEPNPRNLPAVQEGKGVVDQSPIILPGSGEYIDDIGLIRQKVKALKDTPNKIGKLTWSQEELDALKQPAAVKQLIDDGNIEALIETFPTEKQAGLTRLQKLYTKANDNKKKLALAGALGASVAAVLFSEGSDEPGAEAGEQEQVTIPGEAPPPAGPESQEVIARREYTDFLKQQAKKTASKIKSPEDLKAEQASVEEQLDILTDKLTDQNKKWFQEKRDRFETMYQDALKLRQDQLTRAQWGQVMETVALALGQLGAASEGLRRGVDISGARFNPGNWNQQFNQIERDYNTQVRDIARQEQDFEVEGREQLKVDQDQLRNRAKILLEGLAGAKKQNANLVNELKATTDSAYQAAIQQGRAEDKAREDAKASAEVKKILDKIEKRNQKLDEATMYLYQYEEGMLPQDRAIQKATKAAVDAGVSPDQAAKIIEQTSSWWGSDTKKARDYLSKFKVDPQTALNPAPVSNSMVTVRLPGQAPVQIPRQNLEAAKSENPNLEVLSGE